MMKIVIYASLYSCLFLCGFCYGEDKKWDGGDPNSKQWNRNINWDLDGIPTVNDSVIVGTPAPNHPIVDTAVTAECYQFTIGMTPNRDSRMDVKGGSFLCGYKSFIGKGKECSGMLNVEAGIVTLTNACEIGSDAGSIGWLNLSGGQINIGRQLFVGTRGTGHILMTGGQITGVGKELWVPWDAGGAGEVKLYGGTIRMGSLTMNANGRIDITDGTMVVSGDAKTLVQSYINNGWITGYEGLGGVSVVYNETANETTISAILPWAAHDSVPSNGAADVWPMLKLQWQEGRDAQRYDVYLGTLFAEVATAETTSPCYLGEITGVTAWQLSDALSYGQTYYWRVDAIAGSTVTKGMVWSFSTCSSEMDLNDDGRVNLEDFAIFAESTLDFEKYDLVLPIASQWLSDNRTPIGIGSRLEPFVDDYLIEETNGIEFQLHAPTPRELSLTFNTSWEGPSSAAFVTVFKDADKYKMYYRGETSRGMVTCLAESPDGKVWTRPILNLILYEGSKANNAVFYGEQWGPYGSSAFVPFRDTNPNCLPQERYKAVSIKWFTPDPESHGLGALKSPDSINWTLMQEGPVYYSDEDHLDSQNIAFWDNQIGKYRLYYRSWRLGIRDVKTAVSTDFLNWTERQWIDWQDSPVEQIYTNVVSPYPGAEHIYIGMPARLVNRINEDLTEQPATDTLFMTSRDGLSWHRWPKPLHYPGLQPERWSYSHGNNMVAWTVVETASDIAGEPVEWSLYSCEYDNSANNRLRRFTIRKNGFVSLHAPAVPQVWNQQMDTEGTVIASPAQWQGGRITTKLLTFDGSRMVINYRTSDAGVVLVELLDAYDQIISGYSFSDCDPLWGDETEREVTWGAVGDLSGLSGTPVKIRFLLNDADIYTMQFKP